MQVQCSSRVRDLWPLQCRAKSNISNVCSAPLHHPFKRCLPTRLIRSNCSHTGLQPTLRVTSTNLAPNRCFFKLGMAPAYTGGRYRASSPPELLVIHRSSHRASCRTTACSAMALFCHPLTTTTRVSFLIGDRRTPALTTTINPGHLP